MAFTGGHCISITVAIIAIFFSVLGATWCSYIEFEPKSEFTAADGSTVQLSNTPPTIRMGLFSIQYTKFLGLAQTGDDFVIVTQKDCTDYPSFMDEKDDKYWHSAIVFNILVWVTTGVVILGIVLAGFDILPRSAYRLMGVSCITVCALFQGLSMLILKSDLCDNNELLDLVRYLGQPIYGDCKMGPSLGMIITAMILFVITGVVTFRLGSSEAPVRDAGVGVTADDHDDVEPVPDPKDDMQAADVEKDAEHSS